MCRRLQRWDRAMAFSVAEDCHPQTIAVVRTRAQALGIESSSATGEIRRADSGEILRHLAAISRRPMAGSSTTRRGRRAHAAGALVVVAADISL